jgi:hypothetical protein
MSYEEARDYIGILGQKDQDKRSQLLSWGKIFAPDFFLIPAPQSSSRFLLDYSATH